MIDVGKFHARGGKTSIIALWLLILLGPHVAAQSPGAQLPRPNLASNIERPMRYQPEGHDFVIENGEETFNRPLYGRNTAFRVDGGDLPEFVLYLPGRGGNLRLGLSDGTQSRWLIDAQRVTTRYRPGELRYEIRDPLLGYRGVLFVDVLALHETDGVILRLDYRPGPAARSGLELIAAFGGVNGERGARDGDIGTERIPISQWFQLRPEFCAGNQFKLGANVFVLRSKAAHIAGVFPKGTRFALANAAHWRDIELLLAGAADDVQQVVVARSPLHASQPQYFALQRIDGVAAATELDTYRDLTALAAAPPASLLGSPLPLGPMLNDHLLHEVFAKSRAHFAAIAQRVSVRTPDPLLAPAVAALNVAADAVWDEPQQVVMHGAIAWRARLLGWRGAYAMDALAWHDRSRKHLEYWASRQNRDPVPDAIPPAEEATNLARNPAGLHSNGDLSNSHYDMNLVYIDALFRHLLWTGDRDFARRVWPVIQRHLAWERRLFRREFGPQKLPLYEAYAAIWASDDLQYHGGGVTHASAYNWWHNIMAARVAKWLGEDGQAYQAEGDLISRALYQYLWLPEQGMFAEYRDWLGLQRAHPAAALWTFYHALDAPGLVDSVRAWSMSRWLESGLPRLPVRGPGVGAEGHLYATSSWMPYTWSINNVVMGENMHAALALWRARRADSAYPLFRSALLASMYMGISPGNVGTMNYLDVYRRESQRDFADGAGTMSRALVEGLFGVQPDALAGQITFEPGWPVDWNHASLDTPSVRLSFAREENRDRYAVEVRLPSLPRATLRLRLRSPQVQVFMGSRPMEYVRTRDAIGREFLEVSWLAEGPGEIVVEWRGPSLSMAPVPTPLTSPPESPAMAVAANDQGSIGTPETVDLERHFNDRLTQIFQPGRYRSPRSPFVSLAIPSQGIGAWAGHVHASARIDDTGLRRAAAERGGVFWLPGDVPMRIAISTDAPNVVFTSQWHNHPSEVSVPLSGRARRLVLLMAGSTNHMQSRFDNGEVIVHYTDGSRARLALHNPTNWWPIEQDYFIDEFQFQRPEAIPIRVDLASGRIRQESAQDFMGRGGDIPGGAATVLELALDPSKELRGLRLVALANEVVIGLMGATLIR